MKKKRLLDLACRLAMDFSFDPDPNIQGETAPSIKGEKFKWQFATHLTDHYACGTAGCALGYELIHVHGLKEAKRLERYMSSLVPLSNGSDILKFPKWAMKRFDMPIEHVEILFYAHYSWISYFAITPNMVAQHIYHYVHTGEAVPYGKSLLMG